MGERESPRGAWYVLWAYFKLLGKLVTQHYCFAWWEFGSFNLFVEKVKEK